MTKLSMIQELVKFKKYPNADVSWLSRFPHSMIQDDYDTMIAEQNKELLKDKLDYFLDAKGLVIDRKKFALLKQQIREKGLHVAFGQLGSSGDDYFDWLTSEYNKIFDALEFCMSVLGMNIIGEKC